MQATGEAADSGIGMLMNLRKCANHPLLIRNQYDDHKLDVSKSDISILEFQRIQFQVIARLLKTRDSGHKQALESYIVEDLKIMSDFEINKTCETYRVRFISNCRDCYALPSPPFCLWLPEDLPRGLPCWPCCL